MYQPYNGPAGPTKEQKEGNTLYLGELLKKHNIPFTEDRDWARLNWGGDDLNLLITKGESNREFIYVGYDRWGFVAESDNPIFDLDQADLDTTIVEVIKWYNNY